MAPTFILTRTFAISALFVGAFPLTYAAPVPVADVPSVRFAARSCRQMGCLYALPTDDESTSDSANTTSVATALSIPAGGFSQQSMEVIDFLLSALTAAKSASTSTSTSTVTDAVDAATDDVTVDGFAKAAIAAEFANDDVSSDASAIAERSVAGTEAAIAKRSLGREESVQTVARDAANLDALD